MSPIEEKRDSLRSSQIAESASGMTKSDVQTFYTAQEGTVIDRLSTNQFKASETGSIALRAHTLGLQVGKDKQLQKSSFAGSQNATGADEQHLKDIKNMMATFDAEFDTDVEKLRRPSTVNLATLEVSAQRSRKISNIDAIEEEEHINNMEVKTPDYR